MNEFQVYDTIVGDSHHYHGGRIGPKLLFRLMLLYLACGFFCYEEVQFRSRSVEVPGRLEQVGGEVKGQSLYRYSFRNPDDGSPRQATVRLFPKQVGDSAEVTVQWISGVPGRSRLKSQASTARNVVFAAATAILVGFALGTIGYYTWEANHRPLTRQQRAMKAWEAKRRKAG